MATRRPNPLLERALLDTELKLGPEANALRSLLGELAGGYTRTRRVNASNARGIVAATEQARPQVAGAFDQALSSVGAQRAALGKGGPLDPQAAAYERRVGEQRAGALNDLSDRSVRATEGQVFANTTARDEYLGGKSKIVGQLQDLARESGALTASTLGKLKDDQLARGLTRRGQDVTAGNSRRSTAQQERSSIRSSGIDPDTGRPIPGGRLDPKAKAAKVKWASQEQHASARDEITRAVAVVPDLLKDAGGSRAEAIRLLIAGVPPIRKDGVVLDPGVKAVSADFARAAMNVALDGSLSRGDLKRLHNRRLRVKALGYPVRRPSRSAGTLGELARGPATLSQSAPVPLGR